MKLRKIILALIAFSAIPPAFAQAVKKTAAASNGVAVTVYEDDFAQRSEYSSPYVEVGDGQISVASVKNAGAVSGPELTGFFIYTGEWRRYSSAIFKGGAAAKFIERGRRVGQCYSSRYSRPSCTLIESFKIAVTPDEIASRAENGVIPIQVRAEDTSSVIFNIPVAYFDAIREVSKR